eukprot:1158743-Pelagomonas_calceolata.AAC.14
MQSTKKYRWQAADSYRVTQDGDPSLNNCNGVREKVYSRCFEEVSQASYKRYTHCFGHTSSNKQRALKRA